LSIDHEAEQDRTLKTLAARFAPLIEPESLMRFSSASASQYVRELADRRLRPTLGHGLKIGAPRKARPPRGANS
jgi:hypothetical protein